MRLGNSISHAVLRGEDPYSGRGVKKRMLWTKSIAFNTKYTALRRQLLSIIDTFSSDKSILRSPKLAPSSRIKQVFKSLDTGTETELGFRVVNEVLLLGSTGAVSRRAAKEMLNVVLDVFPVEIFNSTESDYRIVFPGDVYREHDITLEVELITILYNRGINNYNLSSWMTNSVIWGSDLSNEDLSTIIECFPIWAKTGYLGSNGINNFVGIFGELLERGSNGKEDLIEGFYRSVITYYITNIEYRWIDKQGLESFLNGVEHKLVVGKNPALLTCLVELKDTLLPYPTLVSPTAKLEFFLYVHEILGDSIPRKESEYLDLLIYDSDLYLEEYLSKRDDISNECIPVVLGVYETCPFLQLSAILELAL